MTFLLYKTLYKEKLFLFLFFLSVVMGFSRCVPIEDLSKPLIGEFILQREYNVSDTIRLQTILSDNFGINRVQIEINPVGTLALPWTYIKNRDSVGARVLNLDESKVIPSNISLGEYELILTIIDVSGLEQTTSRRFIVSGDVSEPTFTDVILPELELIGDNLYQGCRSDFIKIAGTARDNVGLREIRAQFGNFPPIVRALTGQDSVDLTAVFGNALIIPTNVDNGTTLPLQLQATDTEGNVSRIAAINILVKCDDAIPIINSLITDPLNVAGLIEVIQGERLFITGGQVTDDEGLDSIFIYFVNGNTETILLEQDISGSTSVNLANVFGDIGVPIPSTARVGNRYKIVALATDISGNESVAYVATILITRNAPPQILVANTYIDDVETNFSLTTPNSLSAGSTVRVEGKVEEDVALEYYRITWGVEGQELTIVDFDQTILENNLPFNFANPISENEFTTETNARAGTRYILTFFVKDTLNAEVRLRYVFVIQ
jgi:hypothetical protein